MRSLLLIGFALLVLTGCSDGDEVLGTTATPEPTTIAEPLPTTGADSNGAIEIAEVLDGEGERQVSVRGYVVWDETSARLCEVLAESFPPQCGGLSIVISNPDALDVSLQTEGVVRWTQEFMSVDGVFDGIRLVVDGDTADDVDEDPSIEDQALAEAFLSFVADPSVESLARLNLADSVALGLGNEIMKTWSAEALLDPANWTIVRDEFRAWSGPFSALWLARAPVIVTVGPHLRCVADPVPAPPGFDGHQRVSLQPEDASSCLEWWTVDFFLDTAGQVEAITLDLFAP